MGRRFLFAGLGAVGQRHLRNLRSLLGADVELLAYRTQRSAPVLTDTMQVEKESDLETKYGIRVFTELPAALAEKPDAVVISSPTSLHLEVARAAAEAGCHLFIEKPLAHTMEGVPEFLKLVEARNLVTLVGYQWRFHPLLQTMAAKLNEGLLGPLLAVRAVSGEYLPGWHPYEDYRQSYAARRDLGGGVLLTQIHDFDYLGWLFGWPRKVFSVGGKLSTLEIDVEDTASTLMECQHHGRSIPVHLQQDYLRAPAERNCEVVGESGKMLLDLAGGTLQTWIEKSKVPISLPSTMIDRNDMFLAALRHFLACLDGVEKSRIPAREGVRSLQVALAAHESMQSGKAIEVAIA